MIYPEFPVKGDVIGVCAPSAGVGNKLDSFRKSLSVIKQLGFRIVETASVANDANPSASAEVRGSEFNQLLADDSVRTIYSATGGEYNIEMLPYIDKKLLQSHPKWFIGYSDPTNIGFGLTTIFDIACIYGTNAGSFDWEELHEFHRNALSIMCGDIVEQHSFELYDSKKDWENVCMDTPVSWDLYLPGSNTPSRDCFEVSGRLIGGCIDVIRVLIGTPYEDVAGFIDRYSDDGLIWYFDNFELDPYYLYLTFVQMKYAGYFKHTKAVIIGRVMYPGDHSDQEYIDYLTKVFADIPFIWGADIGHTKPAMTIINGAVGHLKCENSAAVLNMELI